MAKVRVLGLALLAVGLGAAPAGAAVPVSGLTYSPRNGAELIQAARLVAALPEERFGEAKPRIELAAGEYVVTEPVVLSAARDASLVGPATGEAVITNGTGKPVQLLRATGAPYPRSYAIEHISFDVRGASTAAFSAVEVRGETPIVDVAIDVPAGTPNVTGLRLGGKAPNAIGYGTSASRVTITSAATAAPALHMRAYSVATRMDVSGGEPTLRMAHDATDNATDEGQLRSSTLHAGPATRRVVEVDPGRGAQAFAMISSELIAGPATTALVDVAGATDPADWPDPSAFTLTGVTLLGNGRAPGVVAHRSPTGAPRSLGLIGVLQLDAPVAVSCPSETGATFTVIIRGIYREGTLVGNDSCTFDETDRRTGDPRFRDRAAGDLEPLVGSSLIDGVDLWGEDVRGNPRPSERSCCTNAPDGDIGALEYQYTPPVIDQVLVGEPGNRGLVLLAAEGHDESAEEDALYGVTYRWRFSDGTELTGDEVEHRLRVPDGERFEDWYPWVELTALDRSGMVAWASVPLDPWIADCEPATDADDYVRGDLCPDPTPTPVPVTTPGPTLSGSGTPPTPLLATPRPTPTPSAATTPRPAPLAAPLVSRFGLVRSRTAARSRRATGIGPSRPTDAAVSLGVRSPAAVTVIAERKVGETFSAIAGASVSADLPKGRSVLRITSRFGTARLGSGLYRVTATITPAAGGTATVRSVLVRITR